MEILKETNQRAIDLLKAILLESGMECEYDREIYELLKEANQLPENYIPYWQTDNEGNPTEEKATFVAKLEEILRISYGLTQEQVEDKIAIETYDFYYGHTTPEEAAEGIYNENFK